MLSDERLARIEGLVRRSLNEEAMPSKVCTPIALFFQKHAKGIAGWPCRSKRTRLCGQGLFIIRVYCTCSDDHLGKLQSPSRRCA